MKRTQVQGVHHITVVGSTRQSAVDFWQGVLGMPFLFEQEHLADAVELLLATRRRMPVSETAPVS
jgi:glyoxalase family protein